MYRAAADPYCYPGTTILINRLGLRSQARLRAFEAEITAQRATEPLPSGRLTYSHYRAIHRHLFQDVYAWAGKIRSVRIAKQASAFCYPEYIDQEMRRLFADLARQNKFRNLGAKDFAERAAHFLTELNAIHPFREGNGRTQLSFLAILADFAGHPLKLDRMHPNAMLRAMIDSFDGREARLVHLIGRLIQ